MLPDDLEELAHKTIGACIAVHKELGPGLLEGAYTKALVEELKFQQLPFDVEYIVPVTYRGAVICHQRLDAFVDRRLVVEIKSVDRLNPLHQAQVISYLRLTHARLGLLVNFNVEVLKQGIRRIVL